MKSIISAMNKLPQIIKIILALPILDIVWNVYRIIKSVSKKNVLGIVLGILCIIPGSVIVWIVDLITTITKDKILWID